MNIRSRKNLKAAKGQDCTIRLPGCCNQDPETVVAAHLPHKSAGRAMKAHDVLIADGCSACHLAIDGQSPYDWEAHGIDRWEALFSAMADTLVNRIERGIIIVPIDAPVERSTKKTAQPQRKSKQSIKGRSQWPKGRKMQSRKFGE